MKYANAALAVFVGAVAFGGGAFVNDYGNHYVNTNNPEVRFDWDNHRMAVPGQGGHHANEKAAVQAHGDQTLVVPNSN